MANHDVALLDTGRVGGGHVEQDVGEVFHLAAGFARHGDDFHPHLLGHLEGFEDIFGVAGGGDAHDDIAGLGGTAQEPREDEVVAVVVAHSGEIGGVAVQRLGVERRTVEVETARKFGREMLRVGRAAAVAAKVNLAAVAQGCGDNLRSRLDAAQEGLVVQNRLLRGDALLYGFGNSWIHFTVINGCLKNAAKIRIFQKQKNVSLPLVCKLTRKRI